MDHPVGVTVPLEPVSKFCSSSGKNRAPLKTKYGGMFIPLPHTKIVVVNLGEVRAWGFEFISPTMLGVCVHYTHHFVNVIDTLRSVQRVISY